MLQTLPGQVAALLAWEVWQLPLAEVPAHLRAFQGGGSFRGGGQVTPEGIGGAEHRAADRESPMRGVLRHMQRAREILLRLEGREVPRPPESLDVTFGDPLHDVPLGILALAIIAANATSSLRQLREEIQERLRAGEEQRGPA